MDFSPPRRIADPTQYPGVSFGIGVVLYGQVQIHPGAFIGDYTIIGMPASWEFEDPDLECRTIIGPDAVVGSHSIINGGACLGAKVKLEGHSNVGPESKVGDRSKILYAAQIHWRVIIGCNCIVGGFCCDRSIIGDRSIMLGKLIHKLENPLNSWDEVDEPSPHIEEGAFVGLGAIIIGDVTVHSNAYVAAGAITTKSVQPGFIVIGQKHYLREEWNETKGRTH